MGASTLHGTHQALDNTNVQLTSRHVGKATFLV